MSLMTITFGDDYHLEFDIESTPLSELWLEKMAQRNQWPLDDPERFYGFDDQDTAIKKAEQRLHECVEIINNYEPIITQKFTDATDQDQLNYLHNIFERYHGLLDKQDTNWWYKAPDQVRKALADLNICVHRAESAVRENRPRLVCTWFGMPKDSQLTPEIMVRHGRLCYEFGGVYLNYVEIGKTLEDLSIDDDHWIGDDAFQPFLRYSADFNIRFYDSMADVARVYRYFEAHKDFFQARGIQAFDDYRTMPRRYKVAQLRYNCTQESILEALQSRQHITDIYLS